MEGKYTWGERPYRIRLLECHFYGIWKHSNKKIAMTSLKPVLLVC